MVEEETDMRRMLRCTSGSVERSENDLIYILSNPNAYTSSILDRGIDTACRAPCSYDLQSDDHIRPNVETRTLPRDDAKAFEGFQWRSSLLDIVSSRTDCCLVSNVHHGHISQLLTRCYEDTTITTSCNILPMNTFFRPPTRPRTINALAQL